MESIITGHKGFIGSHLYPVLKKKNKRLIGLDKEIGRDLLTTSAEDIKISYDLHKIDEFWHLAAIPSVFYQNEPEQMRNNVMSTLNALKMAVDLKAKKFIFFSTAAVFGPTAYSKSKAIGEDIVKVYDSLMDIKIIRPTNVYGIGMDKKINLIQTTFKKILKNEEEILIHGDGKQERDFIYVDDLINKSINFVNNSKLRTMTIGTGRRVSVKYVVDKIIEICGKGYYDYVKIPSMGIPLKYDTYDNICMSIEDGLKKVYESIKSESR